MKHYHLGLAFLLGLVPASFSLAQDPFGDIAGLKMTKAEDKVDVPTTPAPKEAITLFDGKNLDNWLSRNGKDPARWKVLPGDILEVKKSIDNALKKNHGKTAKISSECQSISPSRKSALNAHRLA